ncbi:MAG: adenine phosphoribosyltransferase [Candidatus Lokiarchaeota archaeon]|nr:adenine phosphoribosyltransferase [Candidatus Lokiarchaeota archaeon]
MDLYKKIRNVPDFPVDGIQFKDITTLCQDAEAFKDSIDIMTNHYKSMDVKIDKIVAMEARGYVFAAPLAYLINAGFILVRKPGKLPAEVVTCEYDKEYGKDTICCHKDAIEPGENVLVIDDLLATGGTALAAAKLVEKLRGKVVECGFLIELTGSLNGREVLEKAGYKVWSILKMEVEE